VDDRPWRCLVGAHVSVDRGGFQESSRSPYSSLALVLVVSADPELPRFRAGVDAATASAAPGHTCGAYHLLLGWLGAAAEERYRLDLTGGEQEVPTRG
jgi:hypothetical protein